LTPEELKTLIQKVSQNLNETIQTWDTLVTFREKKMTAMTYQTDLLILCHLKIGAQRQECISLFSTENIIFNPQTVTFLFRPNFKEKALRKEVLEKKYQTISISLFLCIHISFSCSLSHLRKQKKQDAISERKSCLLVFFFIFKWLGYIPYLIYIYIFIC
jgi:hypothetical protein